jgi:exonuclease III/thymidine kinase
MKDVNIFKNATPIFCVAHQNAQGLRGKLHELDTSPAFNQVDVLCFTETWLSETETMTYNISNFNIISKFCRERSIRGGSLVMVNKKHRSRERIDIVKLSIEKHCEISCVEVNNRIILSVYRPPSGCHDIFLQTMENALNQATRKNHKQLIVCGDFNINLDRPSKQNDSFIDFMYSFLLTRSIYDATRITNKSSSCIDNIFTNVDIMETNIVDLVKSDHNGQLIKFEIGSMSSETGNMRGKIIYRRMCNGERVKELVNLLSDNLKNSDLPKLNVNDRFDAFFKDIMLAVDSIFPIKRIKCKPYMSFVDWATPGIKISRKKLFDLYKVKGSNDSDSVKRYVMTYSTVFKRVCKEAKQRYYAKKIQKAKNPVKATWDIIKNETGRAHNIDDEPLTDHINGKIVETANFFNNYFVNVASSLASNVSIQNALNYMSPSLKSFSIFEFKKTSKTDIIRICKKLKNKKSNDLWHMSTYLLKLIIDSMAQSIALIINMCLEQGVFPDKLKIARIIPIYKKGDKDDPGNYRPVSILPVFSKIFESVVSEQLTEYVAQNNILHPQQFGFQKGKNTSDSIASLVKTILEAMDQKNDTYGVFCDLSKAFDCVNHEILIQKLRHYGIADKEILFFKSYLENRQQITEMDSIRSQASAIKRGVPQGSILGPLLFLLYINDLPKIVPNDQTIVMFADDTSLLIRDDNSMGILNRVNVVLDQLGKWFGANGLVLNVTKTNTIRFSLRQNTDADPVIASLREQGLQTSGETKFLGVTIDEKLQWSAHIISISKKLCSAIYAIKKTKEVCGFDAAKFVYFSYFHSIMSYGILFWGRGADWSRVFVLQKRAIRQLMDIKPRETCKNAFRELGVLTLPSVFIYECLIYAYKNLPNTPLNLDHHTYNTRGKQDVRPLEHRLAKVSKSYICSSIRLFNKLPHSFRALNLLEFQREVKKYLVEQVFYNIDDMLNGTVDSII